MIIWTLRAPEWFETSARHGNYFSGVRLSRLDHVVRAGPWSRHGTRLTLAPRPKGGAVLPGFTVSQQRRHIPRASAVSAFVIRP